MPTRKRPQNRLRVFSRPDQATVLLFLTDRLAEIERQVATAAEMNRIMPCEMMANKLRYHQHCDSCIRWLFSTVPLFRKLDGAKLGKLITQKLIGQLREQTEHSRHDAKDN